MPRIFAILLLSASCAFARPFASLQPNVSRFAIYTPQPEYPAEARQRHLVGSGYFVLRVDRASGHVASVEVRRSTRERLLDAAAVRALRQWQFRSGRVLPTRHDPNYSKILVPVASHREAQRPNRATQVTAGRFMPRDFVISASLLQLTLALASRT